MLKAKWLQSKWLAISWFVFITALFMLPGSSFPKQNWLTDIHFDKLVHIGFFAVLVFLFLSAYSNGGQANMLTILFCAFLYGCVVEILQDRFVTNRSFDVYDVVADVVGSFCGVGIWLLTYRKK